MRSAATLLNPVDTEPEWLLKDNDLGQTAYNCIVVDLAGVAHTHRLSYPIDIPKLFIS